MKREKKVKTCPRCIQHYTDYPALSRRDNKTEICPRCGQIEAFEDAGILPKYDGQKYWQDKE